MTVEWSQAIAKADVAGLTALLDAGADVNARNQHGQTGLMVAAQAGDADVVELLIGRGAALNHTAKYGLSALMLAVVNGHGPIVRLLAAAGADRTIRGSGAPGFHEKTAADLAAARGDRELRAILEQGE